MPDDIKRDKKRKISKSQKRCQKELVVATCPQSIENKAFGERPMEPGRDKLSIEGSQWLKSRTSSCPKVYKSPTISHTRDLKEWIRKHAKWPFYTFSLCNLHASNRMVKKWDRRKEAVHVPKLKPVKHLSDSTTKSDVRYKAKNVTRTHASNDFWWFYKGSLIGLLVPKL